MKHTKSTGRLSSTRKLLGASWSADVDTIETAMSRFEATHPLATDCDVVFFEVPADETLHVNVTHRQKPQDVRGWAGPARTPHGFVHNRTFGPDVPTTWIVGTVRHMVFAERA